jgi:hypothetical protein
MSNRIDRLHPAVKHGAYSAAALLPGESPAEFEKLHRDLIAEFAPFGVLEDDIVMTMARLVWRKQNLTTLRIAERAQARRAAIVDEKLEVSFPLPLITRGSDEVDFKELRRDANSEAKKELGENYEFVEIGAATTFDGLTKELGTQERLDAAINRCLKQLLMVRGVKSLPAAPPSAPKRITGPSKDTQKTCTDLNPKQGCIIPI